jgi:hypothetical protein
MFWVRFLWEFVYKKIAYILSAATATLLAASAASAATAVINGITVTDSGRVNPATTPVYGQSLPNDVVGPGPVTLNVGQPGGSNPVAPNQGWDPWGLSDTTHQWVNVGNNNSGGVYNLSGSTLSIVWGSPNDVPPPLGSTLGNDNVVYFFTGANGGGAEIGQVEAYDLFTNFPGITNTQDPGYLISFRTPQPFGSVEFYTAPSAFEFAFVPEPSTWAMMLAGFAGLGFLGFRRSRRAIALSL